MLTSAKTRTSQLRCVHNLPFYQQPVTVCRCTGRPSQFAIVVRTYICHKPWQGRHTTVAGKSWATLAEVTWEYCSAIMSKQANAVQRRAEQSGEQF